jgi:hypothetical protein
MGDLMVPAWLLVVALALAAVLALGWWLDRHRAHTVVDQILDAELARPRHGTARHHRPDEQ